MSGIAGACQCGAVTYRVPAGPRRILNCHCNLCRTMNGSAFSSYAIVPADPFELTGKEDLAACCVLGTAIKHFCTKCGTPLFNLNERYPGFRMLYLGTIERSDQLVPSLNIYCENMLPWVETLASLERLPQGVDTR